MLPYTSLASSSATLVCGSRMKSMNCSHASTSKFSRSVLYSTRTRTRQQSKFESLHILLINVNTEILPNLHWHVNKNRHLSSYFSPLRRTPPQSLSHLYFPLIYQSAVSSVDTLSSQSSASSHSLHSLIYFPGVE